MKFSVHKTLKTAVATVAAVGAALGMASCSSDENKTENDKISIVASTQVWADVVDTVTDDDRVEISAIVTGNDMDPHSFEPTAKDMAKAEKADIIVVGGGGYDSWLYSAVDKGKVIHALELTEHDHDHGHEGHDHGHEGHDHGTAEAMAAEEAHDHEGHDHGHEGHNHGAAGAEENEHVWYNTSALTQVAEDTAKQIQKLNPEVKVNLDAAKQKIKALDSRIHALPEAKVAQTHPIADHILAHTHMTDVTPADYRATTLSEAEPSAAELNAMLEKVNSGEVQLLVDTPQTKTPYSTRIREAAEAKNIPVVEVNETPEKGTNFFTEFDRAISDFEKATEHIGHNH